MTLGERRLRNPQWHFSYAVSLLDDGLLLRVYAALFPKALGRGAADPLWNTYATVVQEMIRRDI